ncbi:uncharacterized protein MICPUCDRAFT_58538 [Micromonas pusilla CCMP1545]|jgi:hypothetical protein|uniref:Predicted protein n=1 Tax=Micromonas pusilla (strain CCMP1545) TaxID=564608 RepID=C1MTS9_MICPC|nr:uncharacterized protein MICPUCDRAFT_58538 [Micromonas pusilla CCMP1545]EEH56503.1 predicted protein [Micromonas pusilla CCMP1545]|mmetsp:Transcript_8135/g.29719  ORF Transcript_8135/g.29719 Transcript_8135/m.29719 type:complete len:86 (+) Transcript_8135:75-332(+)|eukprot:XP_003059371.1 predicted protein [Micromonas pusilla CCMP1545]
MSSMNDYFRSSKSSTPPNSAGKTVTHGPVPPAPKKKAPTRSRVGDPELDATKRRLDFIDDDDDDDAAEREGNETRAVADAPTTKR